MTNDTTGDWVNAITAERAAYQREYLRGGYSTSRLESMMDAHARKCAHIIAQAYHNGDYSDMWLALSMCARYGIATPSPTINRIIRHTINMTGWNEKCIDEAAFDCEAFTRAVHDDAASTQIPEMPAGVWRLLDHLTGNANRGNSVAGLNAAAIGERATTELTASGNLHALAEHPRRYSDDFSGVAVGAYIAGDHAHDFPTLAHVGRVIFQGNVETRYSVYPANYGIVHSLCGSVTSAAARWRQTIMDAEEHGDSETETVARRAHAYLCLALLNRRALPHMELATLIDTMQIPVTGMETLTIVTDASMWRKPITTVEELIDYAATRMSAAL